MVDWTPWRIPLADFGSVNAAAVKKMVVGVGDPDVGAPAGAGLVYVDDIRVAKPAPVEPDADDAAGQ